MSGRDGSDVFVWFGVGGAVFALVGLGILASAVRTARAWRTFVARAVVTRGQVTDLRQEWVHSDNGPSRPIFKPVVRFGLPDGRSVESTCMIGTNPAPAQVGQVVDVRYDPEQPTRVALVHAPGGRGLSCLTAVLGVGLVLFGLVFVAIWVVASRVLP